MCFTGETPLSLAAIKGRLAAVEYLLEMGVNPEILDAWNCTPLHHSAVKGHNFVKPLLLAKGINVDITNGFSSPLQYPATADKHGTVKILLDHGANLTCWNVSLIIIHLLSEYIFVHGNDHHIGQIWSSMIHLITPLHVSIDSQSWQCVKLLLKIKFLFLDFRCADPNGAPDGIKALPLAVGVTQIIKLLQAGPDPNVTNI
ncbi:ankyrin-1-like [Papaver somniferum]|uniref:ankyrin-1-like n=1 Tax=Papaver somniferum TaxID=3469 RepID=UPI000E6F90B7|nr:ankyrin-1-like [Papaver somniferum]